MEGIYLDNNATTKVADRVFVAMRPYLTSHFGHPSSPHLFGTKVRRKIDEARDLVAALLGAAYADEIVFTSGGTESINTAIMGVLAATAPRKHIVATKVEHVSVLDPCRHLETKGYHVNCLSVDQDGNLDLDELRNSIREDTALVSVMWANNETGVMFPIEKIGEIVKERGIVFHVDAVQAVGRVDINLRRLPHVDLLSLSGHKFHGPKGIGALFVRRGTSLCPFIIGGAEEGMRRGGTENVASIIGMGKAAELAKAHLGEETAGVGRLRDKLEKGLLRGIPEARINGHRAIRIPNTTNITFQGFDGRKLLRLMEQREIYASSGAACAEGKVPSHVLLAMGLTPEDALSSIRFGLSRYNSDAEVDSVISHLTAIVGSLRAVNKGSKNFPLPLISGELRPR